MVLKLYNTLTRKKEVFKPLVKGKVGMYSCGPTVYLYAHIGNFRNYVFVDILKRYLKFRGYKLKSVMNITDIDDKTIKGSKQEGKTLKQFTEFYTKEFFKDLETLNIEKADVIPKATETIKDMAKLVKKLIDKKKAYKSDDGSTYYDISKFKNYGKLAHVKIKELKVGARVKQDEYDKASASDFALWKAYDKEDGDVFWETEVGKGRPGWHIECSAMSMKNLGESFDIHTGGVDLIFPHHENEIAQSEGATGKKFVKYWSHNEHLVVDGKKMSKSLGNFYTLRDLLKKGYDPVAIRYLLLSTHYRTKLNFTFEGLDAAKKAVDKFNNFIFNLKSMNCEEDVGNIDELIKEAKAAFELKMDDDLSISEALAVLFDFMNDINKLRLSKKDADKVIELMKEINEVFGVVSFEEEKIPSEIMKLVSDREEARKKKDFSKSDKIRDDIKKKGYIVEDSEDGARVRAQ